MVYTTGKRERIVDFLSDNSEKSYTLEEICSALERNRLELIGVYADWQFSAPSPTTERWYFVARAIK